MSATEGVEATIDALIAKLQADLPAKVAAINAEMSDAWTIDTPAPESITFGSRSEIIYPWVALRPDAAEPIADASGRLHRRNGVSATLWVAHHEEEGLDRSLIRLQRAVTEVVLRDRRPGGLGGDGGYGLEWVRDVYGPTFENTAASEFTSWVRSTFAIRQQQDL